MPDELDELLALAAAASAADILDDTPPLEGELVLGHPSDPRFPIHEKIESSIPGTFYEVKLIDEYGTGTCQCPGFGYRRVCRHLTEARKKHGL